MTNKETTIPNFDDAPAVTQRITMLEGRSQSSSDKSAPVQRYRLDPYGPYGMQPHEAGPWIEYSTHAAILRKRDETIAEQADEMKEMRDDWALVGAALGATHHLDPSDVIDDITALREQVAGLEKKASSGCETQEGTARQGDGYGRKRDAMHAIALVQGSLGARVIQK